MAMSEEKEPKRGNAECWLPVATWLHTLTHTHTHIDQLAIGHCTFTAFTHAYTHDPILLNVHTITQKPAYVLADTLICTQYLVHPHPRIDPCRNTFVETVFGRYAQG